MSLVSVLSDGFTALAAALKATRVLMNGNQPNNNALTTAAKGNLVAAINELQAEIDAVSAASGAQIDDGVTSLTKTYSSQKVRDLDTALKTEILGGALAAYDTLQELKAYADSGQAADQVALANRLRVDAAQGLGAPARQTGRDNLDVWSRAEIGDVTTDYVAVVVAALA